MGIDKLQGMWLCSILICLNQKLLNTVLASLTRMLQQQALSDKHDDNENIRQERYILAVGQ